MTDLEKGPQTTLEDTNLWPPKDVLQERLIVNKHNDVRASRAQNNTAHQPASVGESSQ